VRHHHEQGRLLLAALVQGMLCKRKAVRRIYSLIRIIAGAPLEGSSDVSHQPQMLMLMVFSCVDDV
jgi:ribosomal protein L13